MPDSVNLAAEFDPPETKSSSFTLPIPTATTNTAVDLRAEFAPPPREEQHAIINDAAEKIHQWKAAPNTAARASLIDSWLQDVDLIKRSVKKESIGTTFKRGMDVFISKFGKAEGEMLARDWEQQNTPLVSLPLAPEIPSEESTPASMRPMRGPASILGGAYNGVAPVASSLTSPLNLGTLGVFGALSKLSQGVGASATAAKHALTVIKTGFGMEMARGAGEAAGRASVTVPSEDASLQEKTTDIVATLAQGALAAIAGYSAIANVGVPPVRAKPVNLKAVDEAIANAPKSEATTPVAETIITPEPMTPKEAQISEAIKTPGVRYQYSVFRYGMEGMPDAIQIDAIAPDGKALGSTNLETLKKLGVELPEVSKEVPLGKYTPEQILEFSKPKPKLAEEFVPPAEPIEIPKEVPIAVDPVERITGIKNADVDGQLKQMGLPKAEHGDKLSFEEAAADATKKLADDPEAGVRLVNELSDNPRPLTGQEDALLLHELTRRGNERAAAEIELNRAVETNDLQAVSDAQVRVKRATEEYAAAAEADTKAGTSNAVGLALRRMRMNQDFTLAAMERRRQVANQGAPLTAEQLTETKALHEKITATQKAFDDYVKVTNERLARMEKTQPGTRNTDRNVMSQFISKQASAARERIKARAAEGRVQSGLDPADLADHAIVGAEYITKGVEKFSDWSSEMVKEFGDRVKPFLAEIYAKAKEVQSQAPSQRAEEIRLKSFKTRTGNKAEELQEKLEIGDFTSVEKKPPLQLDAEARALQAKLDIAKEEYANALERDRIKNLSAVEHFKETAMHTYDMARLLMTTGEFSFILRQGKIAALSHPIQTAKALPNAFRALVSDPAAAHALNLEIINHPDMPAARAAKLFLIEKGHSLSKSEEFLMAKWADRVPVVGKFNQAAEVFLNKIRFDMWRSMREVGGLTAAEDKQLAMFVNEATGRGGLGKLEAAAVPLGRAMFSPRFFASRLQVLTGHSMWGGNAKTRRIIATEYARALVGLSAYYSLLRFGLGDDEDKVEIGTDPRSSDFGKVKIGNTRLDPLAGMAQTIIFGARTATGEKTTLKGKVQDIRGPRVPYGGAKWSDVATSFARSKLHPVPGAIVNLFDGTDLAGNKAELSNQALNLAAPITYQDIYQALEEQDLPDGVALGLLAMLGEGLQTYGKRPSAAAPIKESPAPASP